jgi:hypothetical protein
MRTSLPHAAAVFTAIALTVSACDRIVDPTIPLSSADMQSAALIAATPHFAFLPPIAPRADVSGEFDATLSPVVEICEWRDNSCGVVVSRLANVRLRGGDAEQGGDEGENEQADNGSDDAKPTHYAVTWQTRWLNLDPDKTYRIRVLVAGAELGVADVDVMRNARDARSVDRSQFVPLVAGQSLPIRFRIAKGAVTVIGAAGGSAATLDGGAEVTFPAGALAGNTGITIEHTTVAAPPGGFLVAGAIYEFGPHGTTFGAPVQVTIAYDEANLPAGREEHELRLMHFVNGAWEVAAGSVVDTDNNTVSGSVTSFSPIAPGGGSVITMSAWGTAVIDGNVGVVSEWANADCRNFALPFGGSAFFCVMNDATNLYMAVTYLHAFVGAGDHVFNVHLDNTDNGRNIGDDGMATQASFLGGAPLLFFGDLFLTNTAGCPSSDGLCEQLDTGFGGTNNGSGTFLKNGVLYAFEMSKPLTTLDGTHDMSVVPGDIVGFVLNLAIQSSGTWTNTDFPAAADHGHIRIASDFDQQQPIFDLTEGGLAIGGQSNQLLAQVITPGISGTLRSVAFPLACDNGSLIVQVEGVTNGAPNGSVLSSDTIPASAFPQFPPNPVAFRTISLALPPPVTAGTQVALVLMNGTGSCGIFQGPVGDPYAGGDGYYDALPNPSGWLLLSGTRKDLPFKTVVQ